MKTKLYQLNLMQGGSLNKDTIFNENMLKIDSLLSQSVLQLAKRVPEKLKVGDKFIVTKEGEHQNSIAYRGHDSKPIRYIKPIKGMVTFVMKDGVFMIFNGEAWQAISLSVGEASGEASGETSGETSGEVPQQPDKFQGIEGKFIPSDSENCYYLYVSDNCEINLNSLAHNQTTFIIKNNFKQPKKLLWPDNILWQNKKPHYLTSIANAIDIVWFFKMPESKHFIGEIVGINYQF